MLPFYDLRPLQARLASELHEATARVLQSGWFVLGPELETFERNLAEYLRVAYGGRGQWNRRH